MEGPRAQSAPSSSVPALDSADHAAIRRDAHAAAHHSSHGAGHPASGAVAVDPAGLAALLRSSTADLHALAEGQAFQQALVAGRVSREEYAAFLREVGLVHEAIDAALDAHAPGHALLSRLVRDEHRRSPRIAADLAALADAGVPAPPNPSAPRAATTSFVEFLRSASAADPAALVGVLYVTEGATNGNKVIARSIQTALGLATDEAMGYLDPHGADQRRNWMAFRSALDELPATAAQRKAILDAARRTFQYFIELSPQLAARSA